MPTSDSQRCSVFVGNIPYDATGEQLIQICEDVGPVVSFRVAEDLVWPQMLAMCTQNKEQTRQLLLAIPNLSKALFQVQLILGIVTQPMGNPSAVSGVLDNPTKESRRPQAPNNSSWITRPAYPSGLPKEKRGAANNPDLLSRPSKTARLNDGISYAFHDASVSMPLSRLSIQVSAAAETSNPDKQASQVQQLPSDAESALLQQVLSLTPEQLSSLPPDQQKQVIQLQHMLCQLTQPNFSTRRGPQIHTPAS